MEPYANEDRPVQKAQALIAEGPAVSSSIWGKTIPTATKKLDHVVNMVATRQACLLLPYLKAAVKGAKNHVYIDNFVIRGDSFVSKLKVKQR